MCFVGPTIYNITWNFTIFFSKMCKNFFIDINVHNIFQKNSLMSKVGIYVCFVWVLCICICIFINVCSENTCVLSKTTDVITIICMRVQRVFAHVHE